MAENDNKWYLIRDHQYEQPQTLDSTEYKDAVLEALKLLNLEIIDEDDLRAVLYENKKAREMP